MKNELRNFLPLNRKVFEHALWREKRVFSKFEAWLFLLAETRFEDSEVYDGNHAVQVKRGQLYVSIRFMAEAFGWSTNKVLGFLNLLTSEGMVKRETVKKTGQSIITLCNYETYNSVPRKMKRSLKQDRNGNETKSKNVNTSTILPPIPPAKTEGGGEEEKNWRDDYSVYLSILTAAYKKLCSDKEFIADRKRFHPHLNIELSMEKIYKDYWATEDAWMIRKRGNSKNLNWKKTFINSLTKQKNQVYLQKGENNGAEEIYYPPE